MPFRFRSYCLFFLFCSLFACTETSFEEEETASGAGQAMDYWTMLRSYPDRRIYSNRLHEAYTQWSTGLSLRDEVPWESLGPKNVGGRTLCLAFHPRNPETIYAGSASGGLWMSKTGGKGAKAWERIRTGFPVMAVSTIAINPDRPDELFIGTGEVYNYQAARPGIDNRFNRGSYGMGILRSTDGGRSWKPSLDWRNTELRGVWKIVFNPLRKTTLLAATTEGIFRSRDSGKSWQQLSSRRMAIDLEIHPVDTNLIYASYGGYHSPETGIYRSTDGGRQFQLLGQLPNRYTGKAVISLAPSRPDFVYVSIADDEKSIGLYRSIDRGVNWTLVSNADVAKWQGWYAHDVAVHPEDAGQLIYVGIDAWRSASATGGLKQLSYWQNWTMGKTEVGAPEGPANYVHADIHAAYYHPAGTQRIFLATDGGIFESTDNGTSWASRNGGYQTQQFYADLANSASDPRLAVGGLQDNATVIYTGSDAWTRRIGGDGMTASIDQNDDHYIYGSLQNLEVLRSVDRGETFRRMIIGSSANEARNFNGPFVLAPSDQSTIYAGAQRLYVSTNRGANWKAASTMKDGNNAILRIAVAPHNPNLLYLSTSSINGTQVPAVFKSTTSGTGTWERMQGLPEQLCTDLVFHPNDPDTVYALFGGYGHAHLFRTTNGGRRWNAIDHNLPDLPANTLLIDPLHPEHLYLGNDLGVFMSRNGGEEWDWISQNIAEAVMIMDISLSPVNRKLRVATHGLGAYELALDEALEPAAPETTGLLITSPFPNPTYEKVRLDLEVITGGDFDFRLVDALGQVLEARQHTYSDGEQHSLIFDLQTRAAGVYWIVIQGKDRRARWTFRVIRV